MILEITAVGNTKKILADIGDVKIHRRALQLALNEAGSEIINKVSNYIFRPPKTGRWYTYKGRRYQASAPGESPANRSGRLAGSGSYKVRNFGEMTIREDTEYSGYLEFGTYDNRIKPRPHIIRAIRAQHRNVVNAILEHVDKELKG